jgi:hypothetical protein
MRASGLEKHHSADRSCFLVHVSDPYTHVGWVVMQGRLASSSSSPSSALPRFVDVETFSVDSHPSFVAPTVLSSKYDDVFMFDFVDDMHGKEEHYYPWTAYYCRKWNEKFRGVKEHQVSRLDQSQFGLRGVHIARCSSQVCCSSCHAVPCVVSLFLSISSCSACPSPLRRVQLHEIQMWFLARNSTLPTEPPQTVEQQLVWTQDCDEKYIGE